MPTSGNSESFRSFTTSQSYFAKLNGRRAMMQDFDVVIERDAEGYYVASVPRLSGCHTQAKSLDALLDRIREAIELCLEAEGEEAEALDFVGLQRVSVAR